MISIVLLILLTAWSTAGASSSDIVPCLPEYLTPEGTVVTVDVTAQDWQGREFWRYLGTLPEEGYAIERVEGYPDLWTGFIVDPSGCGNEEDGEVGLAPLFGTREMIIAQIQSLARGEGTSAGDNEDWLHFRFWGYRGEIDHWLEECVDTEARECMSLHFRVSWSF